MTNLWDIRPEPQQGDTNDITIFAAMGRATACWEELEVALSWLFKHFVTNGAPVWRDPATAAYGTIVGFRGRADMLEAAARAYFSKNNLPELEKRLFDLIRITGKFSARRNEIAHGIVVHHTVEERDVGLFLQPSFYNTNKHDDRFQPKYKMTSTEIIYFQQQFWGLATDAHVLLGDLEITRCSRQSLATRQQGRETRQNNARQSPHEPSSSNS